MTGAETDISSLSRFYKPAGPNEAERQLRIAKARQALKDALTRLAHSKRAIAERDGAKKRPAPGKPRK